MHVLMPSSRNELPQGLQLTLINKQRRHSGPRSGNMFRTVRHWMISVNAAHLHISYIISEEYGCQRCKLWYTDAYTVHYR